MAGEQASAANLATDLSPRSPFLPWDGCFPWPRYPMNMATKQLQSIKLSLQQQSGSANGTTKSYTFLQCIKRCEAVELQQWPEIKACSEALISALEQAVKGTWGNPIGNNLFDKGSDTTQSKCSVLQPWAVVPTQNQVSDGVKGLSTSSNKHTTCHNSHQAQDAITFSGRLSKALHSNKATAKETLTPLVIATAGAPLYRFIRCDDAKLQHSDKAGSGGGMYHVKQPEWRKLTLTSGSLKELCDCLTTWTSTRVLAELPIASMLTLVPKPIENATSNTGSQKTQHWVTKPDDVMLQRLAGQWHCCSSQSPHMPCLACALEGLADWLPGQLALPEHPQGVTAWSSAQLAVKWWSEGAMEPLRYSASDRLIVQAHGTSRILLVAPSALRGVAPLADAHPYAGYSAPGIAATACPPMPNPLQHRQQRSALLRYTDSSEPLQASESCASGVSNATITNSKDGQEQAHLQGPSQAYMSDMSQMCGAVSQLWPSFNDVTGQSTVLTSGNAIWVPAGWFLHVESLYPVHNLSHQSSTPLKSNTDAAKHNSTSAAHTACGNTSPLPGNVMLEITLGSVMAPRALGALQMQCASVIEGWAAKITGSAAKVRPLLLDLADRLSVIAASNTDVQHQQQLVNDQTADTNVPSDNSSIQKPWVSFPEGTANVRSVSSGSSAYFQPQHWAEANSSSSTFCPATTKSCSNDPCWGLASLSGFQNINFAQRILTTLAPLIALEHLQEGGGPASAGSLPRKTGATTWQAGTATVEFLRRMCDGRLLPTTWLNKLMHNDALLLADAPYTYALEYKDADEAGFPELFAPQLARREKAARKAAKEAHISKLRLTSGMKSQLRLEQH